MSRAVVVICSRPNSARVQLKPFRLVAGVPIIEHILARLMRDEKRMHYPVILAVPTGVSAYDHLPARFPELTLYHGHPDSPLHRMASAYKEHLAKGDQECRYVIRITHDDMLIDAAALISLVDGVVKDNAGYGITPSIVDGAGAEVILGDNLLAAADRHADREVEHISYFVRGDAAGVPNKTVYHGRVRHAIQRAYRLTIDYEEDLHLVDAVLRAVGRTPVPDLDDVCHYLDMHQEIAEYNRLPEVSFYTCAKNAEKHIEKSAASVLMNMGARKSPSEYLLIDDGSEDSTLARMIMARRGDDRVRIIANPQNFGLATSSNIALAKARGKYVMRVDADDYLLPGAVQTMRREMEATGAAIVYANYNTIDDKGVIMERNVPGSLHKHAGCALMNLRLINEIKFRDGLRHWDGLDLFKRVREHFPVAYVEEPLWLYTVRQGSMSRSQPAERGFIKKLLGLD